MGVTILVTRAINLEGRHEHKIPCKAGSVIPCLTTVKGLSTVNSPNLSEQKSLREKHSNPIKASFHETFPEEMKKALSKELPKKVSFSTNQ